MTKKEIAIRSKKARRYLKRHDKLKYKAQMVRGSLRHLGIKQFSTQKIMEMLSCITHCVLCKKSISVLDISIDHVIPISRGGSISDWDNIQFICLSCNLLKGNLLPEEFKTLTDFLEANPELKAILTQRLKASGFIYRRK